MFNFIHQNLYPKFKENEELSELVVDAMISMAYS